jgi:hypothetical protein
MPRWIVAWENLSGRHHGIQVQLVTTPAWHIYICDYRSQKEELCCFLVYYFNRKFKLKSQVYFNTVTVEDWGEKKE